MNTELQNKAWSVLPKELKEEVKKLYREFAFTREGYYVELFGLHNLTSDAEGETELLTVTRQKVMGLYANAKKIHNLYTSATCVNANENQQIDICIGIMSVLDTLFGSKCLPDESASEVASETKSETDKHFDNILKDSFRNERRLNIAIQIMSSILSNQKMLNNLAHGETTADGVVKCIVNTTMMYTDALIAECELTEKLKGE